MDKPKYSVVIPVYKSEKTLDEICARIISVFEDIIQKPVEIILVDDASPDNSWFKMKALHQKDQRIKIIRLARNFGQHNALMCGLKHASGDYIITMDDDLQHPPEEIPKMVKCMLDNPELDAVFGKYDSKKHSWWRNLGSNVMRRIMLSIFNLDKKYKGSSFRLIKASIVHEIITTTTYKPRIGQLILLSTNSIGNVTVRHDPRLYGTSGYSLSKLVKDFINNILNNSVILLRITSIMGFSSAALSVVLALYFLIKYFTVGITVSGFTSIVLINLFYFGVILFSLGVVGEYLIKILFETKGYPQFVIKQKEL